MKRNKYFTVLLAACLGLQVSAQTFKRVPFSPQLQPDRVSVGKKQPSKAISKAADQQWWGYYTPTGSNFNDVGGLGVTKAETYDAAILLNTDNSLISGATVHGVRFLMASTQHIKDVKVWLSSTLPATAADADILVQDVPASEWRSVDNGFVEVALTTPYYIKGNVYAGYSFTITEATTEQDQYPVCCTSGTTPAGAFYLKTSASSPSWGSLAGYSYGTLCYQVLLSNPNVPQDNVMVTGVSDFVRIAGEAGTAKVSVTNNGFQGISNVGYTWTIGGVESSELSYTLPEPFTGVGESTILSLPVPAGSATGLSSATVQLKKVNGKDNAAGAEAYTATGQVITAAAYSPKAVLVEEFTGTWCSWCPRGMVAMDNLEDIYGSRVVGIAAHNSDPMDITTYNPIIARVTGLPGAIIARELVCDPYAGTADGSITDPMGIDKDVENEFAVLAEASLKVTPEWNADSTEISVTTDVVFQYSRDDAPYALAYVLVADSLTGKTSKWNQSNAYSQYSKYSDLFEDEGLRKFTQYGSSVPGLAFNHVAIATWDIENGISGSIAAPLVEGATQTHTLTADITGNSLVQNKKNLKFAAILLNTQTGRAVNAAICHIGTDSVTEDIDQVAVSGTDGAAVAYYTLNGQRVDAPRKGINIVRYANGKSVKMVVK